MGLCRRLLGFGGCLIGAAVCFFVSFWTLPLLALRPSKFALSFRYIQTHPSSLVTDQLCTQSGKSVGNVWVSLIAT